MDTGLVGRETELARLRSFAAGLHDGVPGVALVSGEAGIGKTRLVAGARAVWEQDGARVLVGRCVGTGRGGPPYVPVAAALRQLPPAVAADALDVLTAAVEAPRARLYDLVRTVWAQQATRRPLVVVLEDVHWVDAATRDLVAYLLAAATEGRWGLVVTFRGEDVARHPTATDLLGELRRQAAVTQVEVPPLDRPAIDALAQQLASDGLDPATLEALARRSGGVPLLLEELVVALEAGEPSGLPSQLRHLVRARLARLGPLAREVVQVVAVGRLVDDAVVVDAVGHGDVTGAIEAATVDGLLRVTPDGLAVRHEVLAEIVRDELVPVHRTDLHRRLAEALERADRGDATTLAAHWEEAGRPARAAIAAVRAVDVGRRMHAPATMHVQLERLLRLWDDLAPEDRRGIGDHAGVLARAAEAAHLAGANERAVELAERVVSVSTGPSRRAGALERLARHLWVAGDADRALQNSRRAMGALGEDVADALQAQVLSGHAWMLAVAGRAEGARPLVDEAVDRADGSGDDLQRCRARLARALVHVGTSAARRDRDEAVALAAALDADEELARGAVVAANDARASEDERALAVAADEGWRLARDRGLARTYQVVFAAWAAEARLHLGEWDVAAHRLQEAARRASTGMATQFLAASHADLAAARGAWAELDRWHRAVCETRTDAQLTPWLQATAAAVEAACWRGELATADRLVREAFAATGGADPDELTWPLVAHAERVASDAARRADDPQVDPRPGWDRLAAMPQGRRPAAWAMTAAAERARRDRPRDPGPWREARASWEDVGDPYRAAIADWRTAEALVQDRRGRGEARELVERVLAVATDLGAVPLHTAAERLAATARLGLDDATVPAAEEAARAVGLTPREVEVLGLVATGRTNREIADHLVISPRTVGVHVSRVLRKLGAARRTEAVDLARRRGVLAG